MTTTYWDYIRVEDLLRLQGGLDDDESTLSNHEVLFITVHQVYELWFKLVLRELVSLRDLFHQDPVPEQDMKLAAMGLERATRILRIAADHFTVVETINTRDYLDFRDKLFPASGFQSAQLREIEIVMGLQDDERVGFGAGEGYREALEAPGGAPSPAAARVAARLEDQPTLARAVGDWLHRTPIRGSHPGNADDDAVVDGFLKDYLARYRAAVARLVDHIRTTSGTLSDPKALDERYEAEIEGTVAFCRADNRRTRRIRAAILFIESYRELPLLAWPRKVLSGLIEFEQAFVIFRQRHARMVERVIGRRVGTGGSAGVAYLDETAMKYRVFKDLWAARTLLLRRTDLPELADPAPYEFRAT